MNDWSKICGEIYGVIFLRFKDMIEKLYGGDPEEGHIAVTV